MQREVTIIGAGIVGVCVASRLQRAGARVRLIDPEAPGTQTSYGNAGGLSSAAFVPIAYPGMLKSLPGWLMDPEGPLVVRPGYAFHALPWLMRFVAAGRPENFERSARAIKPLTENLFEDLLPLAKAAGADGLIRRVGQLHLYSTDAGFAGDARGRELRRRLGVRFDTLPAEEIRQLEPDLAPIFRHAVWYPDHGHCADPLGLTTALTERIVREGGETVAARVHRIVHEGGRAQALDTSAGRIAVDEVVIAAGVWSRPLVEGLGHRVPLESQRGYHAMVAKPAARPRRNVQWTERKFIATPMEHGVRFAGTVEIAGTKAQPDWRRAEVLLAHGRQMLPGLGDGEVSRWMGHRPCLPDSVPVIGRSGKVGNVTFAFGHGHIGLITAASTGRLVADIVMGARPSIDPAPYRLERFG